DTRSTWMGSLPHSRETQQWASNNGKHDRWLEAKHSDDDQYRHMPLTMGFYNRDDLPFYYALADAFTVCDQNFCSSLTATEPNRLHLWTGTVRPQPTINSFAYVRNDDMGYDPELRLNWTTFPERLESLGISWKIYQNEIAVPSGLSDEENSWLGNFDDNPIEYFAQYNVFFSATHRRYQVQQEKSLAAQLEALESQTPRSDALAQQIADTRRELQKTRDELAKWNDETFAKLSTFEQNLFLKAFTTNEDDPNYRELSLMSYRDGATPRQMLVPAGDTLYQFRKDVHTGKLPAVSWIVPPERFSDHPCSPWYGAWYLSEVLDILTQNPEVWKKTIFVLCYDENDGYFDHVPPFVPPRWDRADTGKVSAGIDTSVEYVSQEQEDIICAWEEGAGEGNLAGPIGLGFRVPLVIASPWSRGGYVCSQVFDHTSILQLLETILTHKTGQPVRETNISAWRRTVCGDLSSVFRPYQGGKIHVPRPVDRKPFFASISNAQFRPMPDDYQKLDAAQIAQTRAEPRSVPWLPQQEKGTRVACALPYELAADGILSVDKKTFGIHFAAGNKLFGARAAGAPFRVYAPVKMRDENGSFEVGRNWNYAVKAGDTIQDTFALAEFPDGVYYLQLSGPNGFYREFRGSAADPLLELALPPASNENSSAATLCLTNHDSQQSLTVTISDLAYGSSVKTVTLNPSETRNLTMDLSHSHGWYNWSIRIQDAPDFAQRYAGHIETGQESFSDPAMA
ncbi:MAG TPA: phospholipase C, phosphocholine-specific, partial [Pseudomonadales bacterium]|nr:phospholipase C, phosphocholine-specific [Pseudomonadales bacterium]